MYIKRYIVIPTQNSMYQPINIKVNIKTSSNNISLYTVTPIILDKQTSANTDRNAKSTTIDITAKSKLPSTTVTIVVIVKLKRNVTKLTFNINFSFLRVFKYVFISKAIFPSKTQIGKISAIYIKLSV